MAASFTVTIRKVYVVGDRKKVVADVACTGTPTAAGDALTGSALGLDLELNNVVAGPAVNGTSALMVSASTGSSTTSANVQFFVQGTAGASTAMTAFTGSTASYTFRVLATGKGPAAA